MKKFFKMLLWLIAIVIVGVAGLLGYLNFAFPKVAPAPDIKVEITPERLERGKYLANHVAVCMDCHSTRDWSKFSGPPTPGTLGKGGEVFPKEFGFPGTFYSANITPAGLKDWTDGELLRAFTSGVNKNGEALFPIMPHPAYGKMDKEDALSIIAYIRSLDPVENTVPAREVDFPMNFILKTIPKDAAFSTIPSKSNQLEYGKYLFTMASCNECHTKQVKGVPVEGMELAGDFEFPLPNGVVRSANITPDPATGIGNWTEAAFINRFKAYADVNTLPATTAKGSFQTVMPWTVYAGMDSTDLAAIFAYLKTVKPISHKVERFTPAM